MFLFCPFYCCYLLYIYVLRSFGTVLFLPVFIAVDLPVEIHVRIASCHTQILKNLPAIFLNFVHDTMQF